MNQVRSGDLQKNLDLNTCLIVNIVAFFHLIHDTNPDFEILKIFVLLK